MNEYNKDGELPAPKLIRKADIGKVLFIPTGSDPNDPNTWKVFDLDAIDMEQPQLPEAHISDFSQHHVEYTIAAHKISRTAMKLMTGLLSLPGDKPLIHNGKKPR